MNNTQIELVKSFDIEQNTLRLEVSHRGGGIEVDVSGLFGKECKMTAYQNYLGGGMLGSICTSSNFSVREPQADMLVAVADKIKRYFHEFTVHDDDEWENASFESTQKRPASAY